MDRKSQVLTLLVFVIVTSGCITENKTESLGDQAINLHELTVQPSQIYSGSSTNVILHISNGGELPADLVINSEGDYSNSPEDYPYADRVLTDRCRDFLNVEDFSVMGPGNTESTEYTLDARDEVRFSWVLSNSKSSDVPLNGHECNLRFQMPFNYSVNAYRQLQFKESRDAEGAANLESQSSKGPMMLNIQTIGSTSDQPSTFIDGDHAQIRVSMINQAEEGTSFTGFIEAEIPEIEVNAEGFSLGENCGDLNNDKITMHEGESQTIQCNIIRDDEEIQGSIRGEVTASANYRYVQNLGTRTVEVDYRGN